MEDFISFVESEGSYVRDYFSLEIVKFALRFSNFYRDITIIIVIVFFILFKLYGPISEITLF